LFERRVTIKTLAEACGVTHGTVSRALREDPRVKPDTARLIRETAGRLGYSPSRTARNLRSQSAGLVGLAIGDLLDPFYAEVIEGINAGLGDSGLGLVLLRAQLDLVRLVREQQVDGLIAHLPDISDPAQAEEEFRNIPVVLLNSRLPNFTARVENDDYSGACQCMEHLLELGHRRIVYLGNAEGGCIEGMRSGAYRQAMQKAGLDPLLLQAPRGGPRPAYEVFRDFLSEGSCSAVLCYQDQGALGVLRACREAGLSVPHEISVCGIDDIEACQFFDPPLTTFAQPKFELGMAAARMLLERLENPERQPLLVRLQGQLKIRQSTAGSGPFNFTHTH